MSFLTETYKKRLQELSGIKPHILHEGVYGQHLVVVDVQPEYEQYFGDLGERLSQFINENYSNISQITFLYNGADTLGMISEPEYRSWWYEQGLEENIAYRAHMYDKGYAFFRYCMDYDIDDNSTSNLVKYMISKNVNDSRELDEEFWQGFIDQYGNEDIRELIEFSDDAINIPDLMYELQGYNNIVLCGGGVDECLREVEIALNAMDKTYTILDRFTY